MCSPLVAALLSLSMLVFSDGLNIARDEEFASGLLKVLDMERAPNISSCRKAIPEYAINLYKRKFSRTASKTGRTTWIFFPQGNAAAQGLNSLNVTTIPLLT